jgi:hypothetical protein
MDELPVAPRCPIAGCSGTFVWRTSQRRRPYRQFNACGAYDGARFLTDEEKARQKAEKAAKKAKKAKPVTEHQASLDVPQLPVEGWSPADWFPSLDEEPKQMRFYL